MKFRKALTTYEEVEMAGPLYFCHHLDFSTLYGRVEDETCLSIHEQDHGLGYEIEVKIEAPVHYSCYLKSEYNSTKKEFDAALVRAQAFVAALAPRLGDSVPLV